MNDFTFFESASFTKNFLHKHYLTLETKEQASSKSYMNSYRFMYHIQHGQLYYQQAKLAPVAIKPMLLFYGLSQLLKACILKYDPDYPSKSSVLSHGVSTRKRKKQGYSFLADEVKVQRDGLFPHFMIKMFHMKPNQYSDKYSMSLLFKQLPGLKDAFDSLLSEYPFFSGKITNQIIAFPGVLLDSYHMTAERFAEYLVAQGVSHKINVVESKDTLCIHNVVSTANDVNPLFHFNDRVFIHAQKDDYLKLPDLMVYYLVLYNLSMICRYETEWWGERLHTLDCDEMPFIKHFLEIVEQDSQGALLRKLMQS
ncbi:YaaC family protein [Bacillus sp. Marseille-P3800]|uniref:YaaC family protein n=1 Tax=Bacillus sp. Marseille-P3800 TaxID=2014782 RepID=UPI00159BB817|nr:YaaC family protein [Bacillus sp. Marseille-P3800]